MSIPSDPTPHLNNNHASTSATPMHSATPTPTSTINTPLDQPEPTHSNRKGSSANTSLTPTAHHSRLSQDSEKQSLSSTPLPPSMDYLPSEKIPNMNNTNRAGGNELSGPLDVEKGEQDCQMRNRNHRVNPYKPWIRKDGFRGWMNETVPTKNFVPALAVQAFSTGILDATTYADFSTFASNQTGNTILLTVSIIGTLPILIKLTAISLGSFLIASMIFGHLGHWMGTRRRQWLLLSTIFQILWLLISAILVSDTIGPKSTQIGGQHEWIVLLLFASMSGAQVAMARQSGSQELPTAPMTSSYVDLMADKYLFKGFRHPKAGPRNRRLLYIIAMIVGGLLGACIHKFGGSWEVVVVTIFLKCVVLVQLAWAGGEDDLERLS